MTQQQKIKRAEKHFEALNRLFPQGVMINIHGIERGELAKLSKKWEVKCKEHPFANDKYFSATRKKDKFYSQIVLFD